MEIAACALSFGGGCFTAAKEIKFLLENWKKAPKLISSLISSCEDTRKHLQQLKIVLDKGPLSRMPLEQRAVLDTFGGQQRAFDAQLERYLRELDSFKMPSNTSETTVVIRLRIIWKKEDFEDMRREILEQRSSIGFLIVILQVQLQTIAQPHFRRPRSSMGPRKLQEELISAISMGEVQRVDTLLGMGADVGTYTTNDIETTPLHIAVEHGATALSLSKMLLDHRAGMDARDSDSATPLMRALEAGAGEVAMMLIQRGADIYLADFDGRRAIHIASEKNLERVVRCLLAKDVDPDARDYLGETPLSYALRREDREEKPADTAVIRLLLGRGANPCIGRTNSGSTPLHIAAANNLTAELYLLAAAATKPPTQEALELKTNEQFAETPLWLASRNGHTDSVNILLDHGANPSTSCDHPDCPTPLWAALEAGHLESAAVLLSHGADPNARDPSGQSLLHKPWALTNRATLDLLLTHGADPDLQDPKDGNRPLHHAILAGSRPAAARLLAAGADPDGVNAKDETPLMTACMTGRPTLTLLLLTVNTTTTTSNNNNNNNNNSDSTGSKVKKPADIHRTTASGCDALYCAAMAGDMLSATALVARGAAPDRRNRKGNTALHVAARTGRLEMAVWLLANGADKGLRSTVAFEGLGAAGTPAEVAREAGEVGVAEVIEGFGEGGEVKWGLEMVLTRKDVGAKWGKIK